MQIESGLALQVGDGRSLPFADRSFDVAHVSLVIHHLEPDAAVGLLREMARVARLGIVVNDLVRSRPAWIGAWLLGRLLTRNRYTRHDGPLSVRRAYTVAELTGLIASAGLRVEGVARGPWGHRVALVARTPATAARERDDGSTDRCRDRRRRSGRNDAGRRPWRGAGSRSSSWSARRPGAGARVASSAHRPP